MNQAPSNDKGAVTMPNRYPWLGVLSLMLGAFALVTSEFLPASLLTPMAADLGTSEGVAGQTVTATAIMGAIAALSAALVTRRFDRRLVVWSFSALLVVSNLAVCFAPDLWTLLIARLLLGIALGGFWSMSTALAVRLVPPQWVPKAMSIILVGVSAATICAAPAGALMGEWWGWRAVFAVATGLGVIALLTQLLWLPAMSPVTPPSLRTLAQATRLEGVRLGLLISVLIAAGHFAGFTYIRPYLEQVPRLSSETLSAALLVFGVAGFVGNLIGGVIVTRYLHVAVLLAPVLISIATLFMTVAGNLTAMSLTMVAVWGFAFGIVPIGLQTWMARAAPDQLESVGGVFIATFQISIMLGSISGGVLLDNVGARSPIVFTGILMVLAALMFWRFGWKLNMPS